MTSCRLLDRSSDPVVRPTLGSCDTCLRLLRRFHELLQMSQHLATAAFLAIIVLSSPARGDEPGEFAVNLEYPTFGVAPQPPRPGFIPMQSGYEKKFASWAIVEGLRKLGNVIDDISLETIIEPNKDWTTQIGQLSRDVVDGYNKRLIDTTMTLRQDYIYGVQYAGKYLIVSDQLRFTIASFLYQRGRNTEYILHTGSYDTDYFFERAKQAINDELVRLVSENPPRP